MARSISGILRHSGSIIPQGGRYPSVRNGLGCMIDTGGWFRVEDILHAFNTYVKPSFRRIRLPNLNVTDLVTIASGGTEDGSKLRWQFSVLLNHKSKGDVFWQRVTGVFGIRAVVGHTGMQFLEDDRLMMELAGVETKDIPFVVHNTQTANLSSIIRYGLIPGGG
ncbi:MAG: RNA 2'-phosphotransferase, partial [Candidatus Fonsibacter sp.]